MPEFNKVEAEVVYISGKQAEEIGFEKFHQRQAKLQGIHVLVLDHMGIQHQSLGQEDRESITEICADITDLDLSCNLFETFHEIVDLCSNFPKLKVLTLDGNRFSIDREEPYAALREVKSLSICRTLLNYTGINKLVADTDNPIFPTLSTLNLAGNELSGSVKLLLPLSLFTVDLSDNDFCALSDLTNLDVNCPLLHTLILKRNNISMVCTVRSTFADFSLRVVELDLSYNAIDSFSFFNSINSTTCPQLKHLRVTGNPLYGSLVSAEGKALTAEDGYMLTIARSPQLEYLNYSKITEKERLNAETYYLGQIAVQISNAPEERQPEILAQHPRYKHLCDEYGEPNVQRKAKETQIDPSSLAARLVSITFHLPPDLLVDLQQRVWTEEIPISFSAYAVLGMVGKRLGQMPLGLRLVLETNERDPTGRDSGYGGPEWWDSGDDEADEGDEDRWMTREVEMVAGSRPLGSFVEGAEASVRVEMR